MTEAGAEVRRAELVALLSLGTDLGLGQPMEHMIRACLIALRLAESAALDDSERGVVYYSGLLAWVGCHTDAYEQAKWLGDDLAVKRDARYGYDFGKAGPTAAFMLKHVGGSGVPLLQRARLGVRFMGDGRRALAALAENHYLATDELAARLGLGEQVRDSLKQSYERWDGKGAYGLRGDQIALSSRLINLADVVEVFRRTGGVDAAIAVARERSGTQFDPDIVGMFCEQAPLIFGELDAATSWDLVIDSEPSLAAVVSGPELDAALAAVGEFAELKSPWLMGHARGVAELATDAGKSDGLPQAEVSVLRRAALVHDIGRLGVSNAIWDKPAELTQSELERVRLHPYLTERMLSFSPGLAPLGALASQHHERLDGCGYPRGLSGDAISSAGRILAAADSYHARTEDRPHRPDIYQRVLAADDQVRRGMPGKPGPQVIGAGQDQCPGLVDRLGPPGAGAALGDHQRPDRLHRTVPALRRAAGTAGLRSPRGAHRIEGVGLARPSPVLPVRAVHLHHPDPSRRDAAGQAGAVAAGALDPDQAHRPEPAQPVQQRRVASRGGRELLDAQQPADGIQRGRDVGVGVGVHAASDGACFYDGHCHPFLRLRDGTHPLAVRPVNPGLLPRPGRSDRQRRWVPENLGPGRQIDIKTTRAASADSEVRPGPRP